MKTELKFLKFLLGILTIVIVLYLYNCGPEKTECDNWPDGKVKKYYHFDADTLKIPYHGLDTLKFLRITPSDTDTVTFYGQGKKYYTITETDYDFYGCQHDDIYDAYRIDFMNNTKTNSIAFDLFVAGEGGSVLKVQYEDKIFSEDLLYIDWAAMSDFINEFIIYGLKFNRVSPLPPLDKNGFYDTSGKDTLYYNKYQGVLRIAIDSSLFTITLIK